MANSIPLKSLHSFIAVAETGSMILAAEQLNISHSAISQAIKSLESQLNTQLFTRIGRRVELNSTGKRYYLRVQPALNEIIAASFEISASQLCAHLTLNMVNSMALHWWIPRVAELQAYAPELDVRLSNLVGEFNLEQHGVDVALVHGKQQDWAQYHCEKLADDELILVCSPELIKTLPTDCQTGKELLTRFPAIFAINPRRDNDWHVWCNAHQLAIPKQHKNLTFNISVQATQAAMRQLGVLVTHKQFVKDDIQQGMLVQIGEPVLNPHQQFYFATSHSKREQATILILKKWLKSQFSNQ
ncbi:LysR family transcriptional regulator [Pseudoalteromonas sp. SG43-7]|uniref:LysR substrate-binding domain-containing protein n=1 Tax=unclassified Pseudoalteromonas TaxID=194690 RepID=UPI001601AFF7|nr:MULTISPECIES: LysR family transcriptional regulator [unclassified Pseudoalteromonas]MBB1335712.1 LysR family transcriptional regulator [Pseudoalteromonas sp. SR41-6]MBB1423941.1 LysR family transcriptional regulator [Pseudoalteromonas sp. SG43-7]MBB1435212.1 LysR family transcriptional regulator [Pseudoalteromonas sp. SG43-6]MBB1461279.1 LysR family transcriptional regulator [Pseudoalteromonas sp. SG41-8]MBB1481883.1 LysR family transcriptional regulator [Pseudoalteromonas sp. SG41-2]